MMFLLSGIVFSAQAAAVEPFAIEVIDAETGWPVPMVELRTVNHHRFLSDNAGTIAFDLPELMGRQVWFDVTGHGYEAQADAFGMRGVRLKAEPGGSATVEVTRTVIARRLGRITGSGLFAESQKLGRETDWRESGILGSDSVQKAVHRDRLYWVWGDTSVPHYPLGIFDATSATTSMRPLESFEPPVRLEYEYITGDDGMPRAVARMPGAGPTWLTGYVSLPDAEGEPRLVASYTKIEPPLTAYEIGLCVWNDETENFERFRVLWEKSGETEPSLLYPRGHPVFWTDESGEEWVLYGDPFPTVRHPATFEAWQDESTWETVEAQETVESAGGTEIRTHSGSIAWNEWRGRWITVFMEFLGEPNPFGELWYAEADSPTGPWGPAVRILSHDNYTYYNPRLHPEMTPGDSPVVVFDGTFTVLFSDQPQPAPRYDYNQVLYRLDLDDPALEPASGTVD